MFPLLSRRRYLIGVYKSRECESPSCGERKERKWERIAVSPHNAALLFRGHGRSFQDPLSKSFLPPLLLRPSRVSCVHSLHRCRTTGCFIKPTFHCNDFYLPLFLPDTLSSNSVNLSLFLSHTVPSSSVFSYSVNMDCGKAILDWFPL